MGHVIHQILNKLEQAMVSDEQEVIPLAAKKKIQGE